MPLDPEFVADCPYGPDGVLLEEILEVDVPNSRVVALMPTHDELPITRSQRAHPVRHPRHVSGGLMVHMTGIMGFVHAYYVLGLRHADGWVGYGARIHDAKFAAVAKPGAPMVLEVRAKKVTRGNTRVVARYDLRMTQGDTVVYTGDQSALFFLVGADAETAQALPAL
ncbi:MAG: hypothetical protein IT379_09210 [Deltaproteobacteria bacterium]|nr:hypothetical protein [Deltaproteobacteria bacterium]